jgi:hypothetical protein
MLGGFHGTQDFGTGCSAAATTLIALPPLVQFPF